MTLIPFQIKTGSEWHTTEKRSATCFVCLPGTDNWVKHYEALNPVGVTDWEPVGNKGSHGKYAIADYHIPVGTKVRFKATANGQPDKIFEFEVNQDSDVDFDGYTYSHRICGWIARFSIIKI